MALVNGRGPLRRSGRDLVFHPSAPGKPSTNQISYYFKMKRITAYLFCVLFAGAASASAMNIKGTVKDTEGKGIAGVVVSDGLNTVQTDSKGRFRMDTDQDSRFVFISTPSGYRSETTAGRLSYYLRLDAERKAYDFVVEKKAKDDTNHNLIVIADPQISDADEFPELLAHAKDIGEYVKGMDGDDTFGICLGDIVGWNHALYPQYNDVMSHTGLEFRNVIGNHDMTNYGRSFETSMTDYENMYGPAWYSFNVGDVHYIAVNNNFFIGRDWYYIGYLDERQLRWLENDLSYVPEGSTVIFNLHMPTTLDKSDRDAFSYGGIADDTTNKKGIYALLEPYRTIILSGHMHTADFEVISDNIIEINIAGLCGAWWCGPVCIDGSPAGFKHFEINGSDISWTYKGCGHDLDYQMKVYVDDAQHQGYVVANVWDYDPEWKIEYFEDGVKVCDMERFKTQDPLARELYKDPSSLKRTWVYAAPTENMFRAKYSADAKVLEVRATDRFGRVYKEIVER